MMIPQLLQISHIPVKWELEIENARLEYEQDFIPKAKVQNKPASMGIRTRNSEVQIDTYKARASMGNTNSMDTYKINADKGMANIQKYTGDHRDMGFMMSMINDGVTIADIFAQKLLDGTQPTLYMAFLPSTGAEISWIPSQIQLDYNEGQLSFDWAEMRNSMNYVPGSVRMLILEFPKVEIKYTGDPLYFPPDTGMGQGA